MPTPGSRERAREAIYEAPKLKQFVDLFLEALLGAVLGPLAVLCNLQNEGFGVEGLRV